MHIDNSLQVHKQLLFNPEAMNATHE